jgi:hypothetical protein
MRTELPAYAARHRHVLSDVLARLDQAQQAFFQRVQAALLLLHGVGQHIQHSPGVRTHGCPTCGLVLDRDARTARIISRRGPRLWDVLAVAEALNGGDEPSIRRA